MKLLALLFMVMLAFNGSVFSQETTEGNMEMQPQVVAVFPSSDILPANLLRMYVHFSMPMKPIGNLEKIQLKDVEGNDITGALFNNAYELWNHEQTQLTILLDPSRVKTGLRSHEERGRALLSGRRYQLEVGALQDVAGNTTSPFTKRFFVQEEDLNAPNTDLWVFKIPEVGSRDPFVITFPQMLDRLSLIQRLKLTDAENQPVAGQVEIVNNETEWQFLPGEDWISGDYKLYVHSRLEDPSGNNLNGLFDHKPGTLKNDHEGKIETITIKLTK